MNRSMSIGKKIGLGYFIIILILAASVLIIILEVQKMNRLTGRLIDVRSPTSQASLMLLNGINNSLSALQGWMILGRGEFWEERKKAWDEEILPSLDKLSGFSAKWTDPKNIKRLKLIKERLKVLQRYQQEIEFIAQTLENNPARKILFEQAIPQTEIITESITEMIDIEENLEATRERKKLLKIMADLRGTIGPLMSAIRTFLVSGDDESKKKFEEFRTKNSKRLKELKDRIYLLTKDQVAAFERFTKARDIFSKLHPKMFSVRSEDNWNKANAWLKTRAAPEAFEIKRLLGEMVESQQALITEDFIEIKKQTNFLNTIEWVLFFTGTGFCVILGMTLTRSITNPIANTVKLADTIAEGNYNVSLDIGGSFEAESLGRAMNRMRNSLKEFTYEKDEQLWFATSKTRLDKNMRAEKDIESLGKDVITSVADILKADIGAIYLSMDEVTLALAATYACIGLEKNFRKFKVGEGLVGQAALKKEAFLFYPPKDDILKINYAVGEVSPKSLLISPIIYEDKAKGVILLGSAKRFFSRDKAFMDQVISDIGIAFNTAQSREKIKLLLKETEEQAKILKSQQKELQSTNKNLKESNRYKSEFLANMSHELRTPLNSLLILAGTFIDNEKNNLTDEQIEAAKIIKNSGLELLTIINDILDLSKVESGNMEIHIDEIRKEELAASIKESFSPVAKDKGIELNIRLNPDLPDTIKTDGQKVKQILKNLISNAFKFTKEGYINVTLGRPCTASGFPAKGMETEKTIAISVADTGIGIPEEKQKLIFEPFRQSDGTTSRKYGGTGLGLSISKKYAEILGGQIGIKSEAGKGSTFTLFLPETLNVSLSEPKIKKHVKKKENIQNHIYYTADKHNFKGKKIMIVDDDMRHTFALAKILRENGIKVIKAENGKIALSALDKEPDCDLVLMDIMMPVMNGYETIKEIRAKDRLKDIPVMALTANAMTGDRERCIEAGANDYLSKPVDCKKLLSMLKVWLN